MMNMGFLDWLSRLGGWRPRTGVIYRPHTKKYASQGLWEYQTKYHVRGHYENRSFRCSFKVKKNSTVSILIKHKRRRRDIVIIPLKYTTFNKRIVTPDYSPVGQRPHLFLKERFYDVSINMPKKPETNKLNEKLQKAIR